MMARLWRGSAPLTATGLAMIAVLALAVLGLAIDPRIVTGAPVWLKPAKFAVSIAIYTFTLAWIFTFLDGWPRTRRIVGWTTAVTMVLEMAIIGLQAFRGTTSHFNGSTPFDMALVRDHGRRDRRADAVDHRGRGGVVAHAVSRTARSAGRCVSA